MSVLPPRRGGNSDYLADGMLPQEYEPDFIAVIPLMTNCTMDGQLRSQHPSYQTILAREGSLMAFIFGIPIAIITFPLVYVIAAAIANDGACDATAGHIPVVRALEQLVLLCWLV